MLLLAPGILLSFTHGPLFDLTTAQIPVGEGWSVASRFALELVLPACLMGALVGWWLGRSATAAFAMAVAGVALALGPGHNIPMFGDNPLAFKGHAIVLLIAAAARDHAGGNRSALRPQLASTPVTFNGTRDGLGEALCVVARLLL
jgi:hypothetical protein